MRCLCWTRGSNPGGPEKLHGMQFDVHAPQRLSGASPLYSQYASLLLYSYQLHSYINILAHEDKHSVLCITMYSRRRLSEHPLGAYTAYSVDHRNHKMVGLSNLLNTILKMLIIICRKEYVSPMDTIRSLPRHPLEPASFL